MRQKCEGMGSRFCIQKIELKLLFKREKKNPGSFLSDDYHFMPVGAETYGAYGPQGIKIIKQIGKNNTGSYR